jgi:hypothetical protein
MQPWKLPDKIKILEALGAIADDRLKFTENNQAKCLSSDRSKEYTIKYDLKHRAITSDDNSAHWQGRLGYPAIAVLMSLNELSKDGKIAEGVKDIPWKELNSKFNNDYQKTLAVVYTIAKSKGVTEKEINDFMDRAMEEIKSKEYKVLRDE